jgi:ATP-dependent Lon protease
VARDVAEGKKGLTRVTGAGLSRYLGAPKYLPEPEQEKDEVGVATGLAWTQTGGDILYIESTMMRGKGSLALTGHLGDVMKESAQAALTYARSRGTSLGIKEEVFAKYDFHIHVPAGAIPKDGPSAGITMATALISTLTRAPVRRDVAMTGEITLRGKVLPVGGIKEKALGARRMGIKTVIVPTKNDKDVKELPANVKRGMQFVYVDHMDQVLNVALVKRASARRPAAVPGERRVAARA